MERKKVKIPESKQGHIKDWSEFSSLLEPLKLDESTLKFAESYFKGQILISEGKKAEATQFFKDLATNQSYINFEDSNGQLLEAIDIAIKGKSNLQENINF